MVVKKFILNIYNEIVDKFHQLQNHSHLLPDYCIHRIFYYALLHFVITSLFILYLYSYKALHFPYFAIISVSSNEKCLEKVFVIFRLFN